MHFIIFTYRLCSMSQKHEKKYFDDPIENEKNHFHKKHVTFD